MMKKVFTLLLASALFSSMAWAQTPVFSEDFDSYAESTTPTGWSIAGSTTTSKSSNPYYVWGVYSYDGENNMIRMYNYMVKAGVALINTPSIALPANKACQLTFDYSNLANCGNLSVNISTDNGANFTNLATYASTGSDAEDPGTMKTVTVDLTSYKGQTVLLQFSAVATYSQGAIFVDNVKVDALPTFSLQAYKGNSTVVSMDVQSKDAWEAVLAVNPNAVAIVDYSADSKRFAESTKNIILKKTSVLYGEQYYSYSCPNFVLTDLCDWGSKDASTASATDFYSPVDFTAVSGSYSRALRANDYNSVCVPFAISEGVFGNHEMLAYTSYDKTNNNAMFNYVTSTSAGIAMIIKPTDADNNWVVTFSNTDIKGTPVVGTAFTGVFQTTAAYAGCYSVNNQMEGKFSPLAGNLYPFRACFSLKGDINVPNQPETAAPRLVILGEQGATALDELNTNAQDTKFFQNGKLMIRHNGQIFDAAGKMMK